MVTSPSHLNHLGVTALFRVLPVREVANVLGYLLPVWPCYLQKVPSLAGFPSSNRAQRRDSLNFPLLRFNSPSWFIPETSLLSYFVTENTSRGVLFSLQRLRQRKSTSSRFTEKPSVLSLRTNRISASSSHTANYGATLRLFQPLSSFAPLVTLLPFSDR
jgi:hypothetical protein